MTDLIQVRRGTTAEWAAANPVLAVAEPGMDTTTGTFKLGDGVTTWLTLPASGGLAGLEATLDSRYVMYQTGWISVSVFTNSWVNFGGGEQVARYRLVGDIVFVEGLVKSGTAATAIFTLPAGFRPPLNVYFGTIANDLFGAFYVTSGGVVTARAGSNVFFSVNCSFSIV